MDEISSLVDSLQMTKDIEEREYSISVKELPKIGQIKLPSLFLVDGEEEILLEEFRNQFSMKKFSPILFGHGIKVEQLDALDEDFFVGLKVEFSDGNLFIVDFASRGHEFCKRVVTRWWDDAFAEHFIDSELVIEPTGNASYNGMEADKSWRFTEEFRGENGTIPFLVLEEAWSQSLRSLEEKLGRWLEVCFLFAVVVYKNWHVRN
jgi:hypothetical protein